MHFVKEKKHIHHIFYEKERYLADCKDEYHLPTPFFLKWSEISYNKFLYKIQEPKENGGCK